MEQIELEDEEEEGSFLLQKQQQVRKGRLLDGIRIATVDNFQVSPLSYSILDDALVP
jgi:hypothetical protein